MNNAHAWRDVYSAYAWGKILEHCTTANAQRRSVTDQNPAIRALTELLATYHLVSKDSLALFTDRKIRLKQIQRAATDFLANHGGGAPHVGQKQLAGVIDPWITSLARRAGKKAGYLDLLSEYYRLGGGIDASPGVFKTYILRKIGEFTQRTDTLPLVPGVRVEKLDPLHRVIEMGYQAGKPWEEMWKGGHGLGPYFVEWLHEDSETPFWIWLEKEPPCTSTPNLDPDGSLMKKIKSVPYGTPAADFWVAAPEAGAVMGHLMSQPGPSVPFHTAVFGFNIKAMAMNGNAAKMGGAMGDHGGAYVWSKDGLEIYSGKHVPGELHHSTFTAGGKVKCAGTWQTNAAGQVTCVTRDSGHYQPTAAHLKEFCQFLNGGYGGPSVFHPEARTFPFTGGGINPPFFTTWQHVSAFIA